MVTRGPPEEPTCRHNGVEGVALYKDAFPCDREIADFVNVP